jgi:hypothetical protein
VTAVGRQRRRPVSSSDAGITARCSRGSSWIERPEAFHFVGIAMILSGIYTPVGAHRSPVPAAAGNRRRTLMERNRGNPQRVVTIEGPDERTNACRSAPSTRECKCLLRAGAWCGALEWRIRSCPSVARGVSWTAASPTLRYQFRIWSRAPSGRTHRNCTGKRSAPPLPRHRRLAPGLPLIAGRQILSAAA